VSCLLFLLETGTRRFRDAYSSSREQNILLSAGQPFRRRAKEPPPSPYKYGAAAESPHAPRRDGKPFMILLPQELYENHLFCFESVHDIDHFCSTPFDIVLTANSDRFASLRQYRTILMVQMRRQIFRQSKQKFARIVAPLRRIFVTNDGKDASRCAIKATAANCAVLP